ncbi:MAG: DUF2179 domain-containing protein [Thermoanaerobacteraceae bacterium]|nr:DUF2179 domain-containing protein [Thermoanaerobacteraceae bacterium]
MLSLIGGYLFIFLARVADVSLATMRTLMIVRGKGLIAAGIGFFEVMIYITALNKVVSGLDNPANLVVYALGFATGNFMGSYIEEKLAIGLTTVQIISHRHDIGDRIRNMGFGVTSLEGKGREGFKEVLIVSLPRKELDKLLNFIDNNDRDAFVTIMDTRASKGGYFKQTMKNK